MAETNWQKFMKHCRTGGFFYAVYRGIKYLQWRRWCKKRGIDLRQFSKEEGNVK